jgi:hypothetical protein
MQGFLLKPHADAKDKTQVMVVMHADPKGSVPKSIIAGRMKDCGKMVKQMEGAIASIAKK